MDASPYTGPAAGIFRRRSPLDPDDIKVSKWKPGIVTKNDAADAAAIWETVQRPVMRFVAVKSEEKQSILSLHGIREQRINIRTM